MSARTPRRTPSIDRPAMPAQPDPAPDPHAPPPRKESAGSRAGRRRYTIDLDATEVEQLREWSHVAEVDRSALFLAFLRLVREDPALRVRVEALARDIQRPRGPRR